jgi:hypothetical protein
MYLHADDPPLQTATMISCSRSVIKRADHLMSRLGGSDLLLPNDCLSEVSSICFPPLHIASPFVSAGPEPIEERSKAMSCPFE